MVAWIIYFKDGAEYNKRYIDFYIEEGKKLGITVELIIVEDIEFGVKENEWFLKVNGKQTPKPDFAICRAIYPLLSRQLELMGVRVFNNSFVSEICNDKARTYQYLAKTGIKMVDSSFYKNRKIEDVISKAHTPTVIKAVDGHGGSQVFLINNPYNKEYVATGVVGDDHIEQQERLVTSQLGLDEKDMKILQGLGSSDVVVQPLTGSRHQDLRVYVIGKEIIASVLRTAKDGFKSNFSLGGDVRLYELSKDEIQIANTIIKQFDFDLVGIDFIIGDQGELIFNEVEDVVGSRMLYKCSDINIVEKYLKYILRALDNN